MWYCQRMFNVLGQHYTLVFISHVTDIYITDQIQEKPSYPWNKTCQDGKYLNYIKVDNAWKIPYDIANERKERYFDW
jgi:hypothetical protein